MASGGAVILPVLTADARDATVVTPIVTINAALFGEIIPPRLVQQGGEPKGSRMILNEIHLFQRIGKGGEGGKQRDKALGKLSMLYRCYIDPREGGRDF